jgi:hypothetical protein
MLRVIVGGNSNVEGTYRRREGKINVLTEIEGVRLSMVYTGEFNGCDRGTVNG